MAKNGWDEDISDISLENSIGVVTLKNLLIKKGIISDNDYNQISRKILKEAKRQMNSN